MIVNPWYISGFVDGEGCFSLVINTENRHRGSKISIYHYWVVDFSIHLREDDKIILQKIQNYFNAGRINIVGKKGFKAAHFNIRDRKDLLEKVIGHFDKYPLLAKKKRDFELWREAVLILEKAKQRKKTAFDGQSLSVEEEKRLYEIRDGLALRLTNKNKQEYEEVRKGIIIGKEVVNAR